MTILKTLVETMEKAKELTSINQGIQEVTIANTAPDTHRRMVTIETIPTSEKRHTITRTNTTTIMGIDTHSYTRATHTRTQ